MMMSDVVRAKGHVVELARTDPRHIAGSRDRDRTAAPGAAADPARAFADVLVGALETVNQRQMQSAALSQRMVTDPDSVDIHNVTIAMAEANMALSVTKTVVDRAVRAFREIMSLR